MRRWTSWLGALAAAALIGGCGGGGSVAPPTNEPPALAARVVIEQSGLLLTGIGASAQLQASARGANDARQTDAITWSSNRPEVVLVDATGRVVAQAAVGSAQIVAHAGPVSSAPLLVVVAVPALGVRVLSDEEIAGDPVEVNPAAPPSRDNTYQITLATAVDLPSVGARMLGTGSKPLAGEVVAVDAAARSVTLRPVLPRLLLPGMRVNEVIDLSQAELGIPADIAARYEVRRNGASFDYVPRSGALQTGRAHALAAVGTRALPPFSSCETTVTGRGADAPLPIGLSAPPLFSVSLPSTIEYVDTPENGVERLVLRGDTSVKTELSLGVAAAFEGKFECKAELGTITVPIGGLLAWVAGGQIPFGIGFELGGKLTVANFGIGGKAEVSGPVELGFACVSPAGCGFVRNLDLTPKNEWTTNAPSLGDLRVDLGLSAFGFAKANFGSRIFRSLQVEGFTAKFGGKLTGSFAPQVTQIIDTAYQSDYKLSLEASAGIGRDFNGILKLLGVSSVSALELSVSRDLGRSPTGTLTADRSRFTVGDQVNFKATLANLEFPPGFNRYNVDKVMLVRDSGGTRTEVASVTANTGQSEFNFRFDATSPGRVGEFYAFVVTKPPFGFASLELANATGPNAQVTVTPLSANIAAGATQSFVATVTGTPLTDVTWSASAGSISSAGVFTAPGQSATVQVVATSVADPTVNATATVFVGAAAGQVTGTITVVFDRSVSSLVTHPADLIEGGYTNKTRSATSERAGGVASFQVADVGGRFNVLATTFSGSAIRHDEATSESEFHGCYTMDGSTVDAQASAVLAGGRGFLVIASDGTYVLDWGADMLLDGSKTTMLRVVSARVTNECIQVEGDNSSTRVSNANFTLAAAQGTVQGMGGVVTGNSLTGSATRTFDLSDPNIGQTGQETVTISWDLTRN